MLEIVKGALPLLLRATVCGALAVPTRCEPKATLESVSKSVSLAELGFAAVR